MRLWVTHLLALTLFLQVAQHDVFWIILSLQESSEIDILKSVPYAIQNGGVHYENRSWGTGIGYPDSLLYCALKNGLLFGHGPTTIKLKPFRGSFSKTNDHVW